MPKAKMALIDMTVEKKKSRDKSPKPAKGGMSIQPMPTISDPEAQPTFLFNIVSGDPWCSFQRAVRASLLPADVLKTLYFSTKLTIDIDDLLEKRKYTESWQNCFTDEQCDQLLGFLKAIGFDSIQYPDTITVYPSLVETDTWITELKFVKAYKNCQVVNFHSSATCDIPCKGATDAVGRYLLGEFSNAAERSKFVADYGKALVAMVEKEGY
jgi:hypothetical protein